MNKFSLKLEKISSKVDLKLILSLVNAIMGILRSTTEARTAAVQTEQQKNRARLDLRSVLCLPRYLICSIFLPFTMNTRFASGNKKESLTESV